MRIYDVLLGNDTVGSAEIREVDLYCRVQCICKLPSSQIYRILMVGTTGELLLGVCVPNGDEWILERKIPAKKLPGEELQFYIIGSGDENAIAGKLGREEVKLNISALRNMRYSALRGHRGIIKIS